jgi:hypothetical protein
MSYRGKFLRDITGQTGYQQRKAQLLNALGPKDWPLKQRAAHFWEKLGPQFAVNAVMFAALRPPACGGPIRYCGYCRSSPG